MGYIFEGYRSGYQAFIVVEMLTGLTQGMISAFTLPNAPTNCYNPLIFMTVTQGVYTAALIATHPFINVFDNIFFSSLATLQFVQLTVATTQINNESPNENKAIQNFIEITPLIIQTAMTIRTICDIAIFVYSVYKGFKQIQQTTLGVPFLLDDDPFSGVLGDLSSGELDGIELL